MILNGDSLEMLRTLPDGAARCCITSPPYWGLRDYGHAGQIGLERTPDEYVSRIVEVFREVRRVLSDDGTLWLNIGDSYASGGMSNPSAKSTLNGGKDRGASAYAISRNTEGLKPKNLVGIPWRVAFALQADGWWLRQDIIWHKPNPMPESVTDRCTKAHEYVFLLTKSERYYYDAKAISEPAGGWNGSSFASGKTAVHHQMGRSQPGDKRPARSGNKAVSEIIRRTKAALDVASALTAAQERSHSNGGFDVRNKRSVWTISTQPFREAHFAVMPEELALVCAPRGLGPRRHTDRSILRSRDGRSRGGKDGTEVHRMRDQPGLRSDGQAPHCWHRPALQRWHER